MWSTDVRKIIHAVKGWITGANSGHGRGSAIIYTFSSDKESQNSEINPNDQIAVLRRISTYTSKEDIPVTVIFPGRPSRKIPDGSQQNGVTARYATADQLRKVILSSIGEARKSHSPVLATNNAETAKLAGSEHIRHIRASTFEEALDSVCGPLRRDQPQQQQQQRRPAQQAPKGQPTQGVAQTPAGNPPGESATQAPEAETTPIAAEPAPEIKPEPKPEPVPRKLQRYEPTMRKEIKDQAILDLIDPL